MDKATNFYKFIADRPEFFEGGHSVHTPKGLVEEILSKIELENRTVLVLFNIEFVISLVYTYGVSPENITFYSDHDNKTLMAERFGVKYCTSLDNLMKFDVVLANPPYNSKDVLLYPAFFKLSLELAETVVMVMPTDLNSQQVRLKKHNHLVKKHMTDISENVTEYFGVGIPDIRYITASKNHVNEVPEYVDPLDSYQIILPERERLNPRRGNGQFSRKSNLDPNGVKVIGAIYRGNRLEWATVKPSVTNHIKSSMQTNSPWMVLVGENPSRGLFNVAVIENKGFQWGSGIFALDAASKSDAESLAAWMVSPTIQAEVQKMLTLKNTHSFSGLMMKKLPRHV